MRSYLAVLFLAIATPVCAQTMGSSSGATSTVDISSPAETTNHLITTPTVAAPGLAAAGVETCLGSTAGGLSLMGGGITFGSTRVDEGCTIRLLARQLYAFGFQKAAMAMMCEDEHVVLAMAAVDSPCLPPAGDKAAARVSAVPEVPAAQQQQADSAANSDPIRAGSIGNGGGYILDLAPAPAKPEEHIRLSFAPQSLSTEEETWFDRESKIN